MITCSNCGTKIEKDIIDDAGNIYIPSVVVTPTSLIVPEDSSLCGECYEEDTQIRNNGGYW